MGCGCTGSPRLVAWPKPRLFLGANKQLALAFALCVAILTAHVEAGTLNRREPYPPEDFLPYSGEHGATRSLDEIQRGLRSRRDNHETTFETYRVKPEAKVPATGQSYVERRQLDLDRHLFLVSDPFRTVSFYEPGGPGGCNEGVDSRARVSATARHMHCEVAVNAGFFNTKTGACYGDIVSDGTAIKLPRRNNAHFGIRADGTIEVGYLDNVYDQAGYDRLNGSTRGLPPPFVQLMTGAIWLVRNGTSYVEAAIWAEDQSIEETGSLRYFSDVKAGRTAIGHDKDGKVVIAQVDGDNGNAKNVGLSLWDFAQFLIEQGVVNAINLDGGGSSASVVNGTLVSYPKDSCKADECGCPFTGNETSFCEGYCQQYRCERHVTTIACVHQPLCNDGAGCGHHGTCQDGVCICKEQWTGEFCDVALCPAECQNGAMCVAGACLCPDGFSGSTCEVRLCNGGLGCSDNGLCLNGTCRCFEDWKGPDCSKVSTASRRRETEYAAALATLALLLVGSLVANCYVCCLRPPSTKLAQCCGRRAASRQLQVVQFTRRRSPGTHPVTNGGVRYDFEDEEESKVHVDAFESHVFTIEDDEESIGSNEAGGHIAEDSVVEDHDVDDDRAPLV